MKANYHTHTARCGHAEGADEEYVLRLYEDMVAGRISEANFNLMLDKTQKEQVELKERVAQGRKKLADEMRLAMDAKQWVDAIQEYADITERVRNVQGRSENGYLRHWLGGIAKQHGG